MWEGLARNVEYLDTRDDVRQFLGNWYARRHSLCDESDSSDMSDSKEDEIFSPAVSPILDPDTDADVEDEDESDGESNECTPRRDLKEMAAVSRLLARSGLLLVNVRSRLFFHPPGPSHSPRYFRMTLFQHKLSDYFTIKLKSPHQYKISSHNECKIPSSRTRVQGLLFCLPDSVRDPRRTRVFPSHS